MLLPKQVLSADARRSFRLVVNPFKEGLVRDGPDGLYLNGEITFVREVAWQAIKGGLVAIVGESGAGKTTVLDSLKDEVLRQRLPVRFIEPSVEEMEDGESRGRPLRMADIHAAIAYSIDPRASVAQTRERPSRQVLKMLTESAEAGYQHLLVIEEAHAMPTATLNQLKRLRERMKVGSRRFLGILLLGHPELEEKLMRHDVRESMQRVELVRLRPLGADLPAYLQHRAEQAGAKLESLITPEGIDELRTRLTVQMGQDGPASMLYPLNVNNWMIAALNTAAGLGAPRVDRDVIRAL